jgi:hypothetical protein
MARLTPARLGYGAERLIRVAREANIQTSPAAPCLIPGRPAAAAPQPRRRRLGKVDPMRESLGRAARHELTRAHAGRRGQTALRPALVRSELGV